MTEKITLTLDEIVIKQIKKKAEKENRSISNMIDSILKNYLKDNKDE